ncbi:DNA-directed RNA polymerase subunit beta [Hordeum vulgare]|nr:DNA-directed RNA polymerase subunit beta [Hordeum vulgare]
MNAFMEIQRRRLEMEAEKQTRMLEMEAEKQAKMLEIKAANAKTKAKEVDLASMMMGVEIMKVDLNTVSQRKRLWFEKMQVIDLGLEVINPVIEPGEVLPNIIDINLVLVGELRDHHVVGVESMLHHPLALEDLLFHCFEPRLHDSGLLGPLNITDVQHPLTHLDRLRVLQHSR